jgi:hypothetical protein
MAEGCRSAARLRSAAWCRRNGQMAKSAAVSGRSPFAAIVGRRAAIEQPLTESDAVGAGSPLAGKQLAGG